MKNCSDYFGKNEIGLSVLDVSTGVFKVTQINGDNALSILGDELQKLDPREIIIPDSFKNDNRNWLPTGEVFVHTWEDGSFSFKEAYRNLVEHFKTQSLEGFGCENMKAAISSAGALIHYLRETQKSPLDHITALTPFPIHNYMALDQCSLTSLELVQSSEGTRKNSLLDLLDLSLTPMGARRIREWILKPLISSEKIQERLSIVEGFKDNPTSRKGLRDLLKQIFDLERLLGRITLSACNARDLVALKASLKVFPDLLEPLKGYLILAKKQFENPLKYSSAWNFGNKSKPVTTVSQIVEYIINYWGSGKLKKMSKNKIYEQENLQLNSTKALKLLKWKPTYNIKQSVKVTTEWYYQVLKLKKKPSEVTNKQIENYMYENKWS